MAASEEEMFLGQLDQEATCLLCLDFLEQPMGLPCGHNFCCDCLAKLGTEFYCPECRVKVEPGTACPNRPLANIICHLKRLRLSEGAHQESSRHPLCQEHEQPLQIFCSSEKSLLCLGCLGEHQGHPLLSLPEAARGYKNMLDSLLEPLRKEEQKLLEQRQAEEESQQECQERFAAEKRKVGLALESLQELLQERQPVWLAWLAKLEEKMEAEWEVALAQLSGETSCLQLLLADTERKCCQPDGEFLQDIQDTVDRCRSYLEEHAERVSPRLQERFRTLLEKNSSVKQVVDRYKASLQETLTVGDLEQLLATGPAVQKRISEVRIVPDNYTAHPQLQCHRRMVCLASRYQVCLNVPERFSQEFCVLGRERFTTGSHWWEVSVLELANGPLWDVPACWAIGVAKESIRRKAGFRLKPQDGIWAMGKNSKEKIVAFAKLQLQPRLQRPLQTLQVRLEYEAEKVEFLDAETEVSLYTFQTGPLYGEQLRPFFYLGQEGVTLSM